MHALLEQLERQITIRDEATIQAADAAISSKQMGLLRGSTGSLGAHILEQLASLTKSRTLSVYLNRFKYNDDACKHTEDLLQVCGLSNL